MTSENLNKGNNNFEYAFLTTCNPNKDTNIHNDYRTKTFQSICDKNIKIDHYFAFNLKVFWIFFKYD